MEIGGFAQIGGSRPVSELQEQLEYRSAAVREGIAGSGIPLAEISAIVGRGGLLKPLPGGVYEVNEKMKADLRAEKYGRHASNLGALLADSVASELRVPAFIVDPVVVDELAPVSRHSGSLKSRVGPSSRPEPEGHRKEGGVQSGKQYGQCSLVVAHMGGGTSIGIHVNGMVVDVNNALDGDGPFAIERAGTVPAGDWMRWVLAHQHDPPALQLMLTGRGGLVAYLGTNDFPSIEESADGAGALDRALSDELIHTLCYQVAKSIAGLAAFTNGRLDAVVLTGGLAYSPRVVKEITERVSFLGPVLVFPVKTSSKHWRWVCAKSSAGRLPRESTKDEGS